MNSSRIRLAGSCGILTLFYSFLFIFSLALARFQIAWLMGMPFSRGTVLLWSTVFASGVFILVYFLNPDPQPSRALKYWGVLLVMNACLLWGLMAGEPLPTEALPMMEHNH